MVRFPLYAILCASTWAAAGPWQALGAGVEYASFAVSPKPSIGDGQLHVVRVDSTKAHVRALASHALGGENRTARQWLDEFKLVAVINAGMYEPDFSTHTGYFRVGGRELSPKWVKSYQSILLLGPREAGAPPAALRDATPGGASDAYGDYDTVIQNLRLIRGPGTSVWTQNVRQWSEAAIATDSEGRLLFLFCRSPLSMADFNQALLALPLGVTHAMHVEGGPEASLSVRGGGVELDLSGSYETGFKQNDSNLRQWRLPNVLGVEVRPSP